MPQKIVRRRRKAHHRAPIFTMIAVMLLLIASIIVSFFFFIVEDMNTNTNPYSQKIGAILFGGVDFTQLPSNVKMSDKLANSPVVYKPIADPGTGSSGETAKIENVPAVSTVPETALAPANYFDDAIFIGDSISLGIKNSGVIPAKNMVVEKSVGIDHILSDKAMFHTTGSEAKTLFQAISEQMPKPGKIYVLLGLNGMGYDNDYHIQMYSKLVDRLKKTFPDAIIYVESLTPIMQSHPKYPRLSTEKIKNMNSLIQKMAEEKEVYYLSVQDALVDKNGYLKADYNGGDNVHLNTAGHKAMFQYYKTHVVLGNGTMDKVVK